ncbi:hypothetical protein [Robertmurraya korlensis]
MYPPNLTPCVNREVIGIFTQIEPWDEITP